ncbi:unnamed protein product [Ectocarpus sp. 4 AP-2014]
MKNVQCYPTQETPTATAYIHKATLLSASLLLGGEHTPNTRQVIEYHTRSATRLPTVCPSAAPLFRPARVLLTQSNNQINLLLHHPETKQTNTPALLLSLSLAILRPPPPARFRQGRAETKMTQTTSTPLPTGQPVTKQTARTERGLQTLHQRYPLFFFLMACVHTTNPSRRMKERKNGVMCTPLQPRRERQGQTIPPILLNQKISPSQQKQHRRTRTSHLARG